MVVSPAVFANNIVSRPVGFVRFEIPADGSVVASIPFQPFDPHIASVFECQLVGPTNICGNYCVLQWDRLSQEYVSATKNHGSEKAWLDNTWLEDPDSERPSGMTILPGQAFWIEAHSDQPRNAYLWGEVILDQTFEQVLFPGVNLFGHPFPSSVSIENSGLLVSDNPETADLILMPSDPAVEGLLVTGWPVAPVLAKLQPGVGYWYQRRTAEPLKWKEPRPYADVFPTGGPPRVVNMHVNESGEEIGLEIECSGEAGETLGVLYKDLTPGSGFDTTRGWHLADVIPSGERAAESEEEGVLPTVCWNDGGAGLDRWPRVNQAFGRCYVVIRADIDTDKDSIPDGLELFVYDTDPKSPDTDGDGMPDGWEISNSLDPLRDDGKEDPDHDGRSNLEEFQLGTRAQYAREQSTTIYVSCDYGNDEFLGFLRKLDGRDGPKRTVNGALKASIPGDTILVEAGTYHEGVDMQRYGVHLRFAGHVVFQ